MLRPALLAVATVGLGLAAPAQQKNFDLPTLILNPQKNNLPLASSPMRYQQWYSHTELMSVLQAPARITGLAFKAGSPGGQAGKTIDLEVTIANSVNGQPSGSFEGNLVAGRTVVLPRTTLTLGPANPGTFPLNITFQNEFVWNGHSAIVVDLRIFGNGNNNQPYQYDLEFNVAAGPRLVRLWALDPNASTATNVRAGEGITTRFFYKEAINFHYGVGCPGRGNVVPIAITSGGHPIPGNTALKMELRNAPPLQSASFFMGVSRTQWGSLTLPYDLGALAPGCSVLAEPLAFAPTLTTTGGGPGTGSATLPFPMPPVTGYVGTIFYSQWLILDPFAPNGVLAMTNGVMHVTALQ